MSNNNPHGHLNQPTDNPSWNPLQIPSYIPRQPQLAHISNERSMDRSALAWHAPPPDSIYNFMSANSKNLDPQMNPLLPHSFVRGPLPFDSMDLSLQSSRNAITPLTKSGMPPASQLDFVHSQKLSHQQQQQHHQTQQTHNVGHQSLHQQQQQNQQLHQHQQQTQQQLLSQHLQQTHNSNYPSLHNLSASHNSSLLHSQHQHLQQHLQQHHQQNNLSLTHNSQLNHSSLLCGQNPNLSPPSNSANNAKYLGANGNECESMLPPASPAQGGNTNNNSSSSSSSSNSNVNNSSPLQYMRDNESNYGKNSLLKRGYDPTEVLAMHKSVDLNSKDLNYASLMANKLASAQQAQNNNKKPSPLRNYSSNVGQHHAAQLQQHHLTYSNLLANKRNGPHSSPQSQSPIHQSYNMSASSSPSTLSSHSAAGSSMHQSPTLSSLHAGNGPTMMDYNSLHLPQPTQQNNYPLSHTQHMQHHHQYLDYQMPQNQHLQQQQQQALHQLMQQHHQQQQQQQQQLQQQQQQQHQQQHQQNLQGEQSPSRQQSQQQSPLQQQQQQPNGSSTQQLALPQQSKQLTPSQTPHQSPIATQRTPLSSPMQTNFSKSADELKKPENGTSPFPYKSPEASSLLGHNEEEDSQQSSTNSPAKGQKRKVKNFPNPRATNTTNEDNEENQDENHLAKKSSPSYTTAASTPKSSPSQSKKSPRSNSFAMQTKDNHQGFLEKDKVIPPGVPLSSSSNKSETSETSEKKTFNENGRCSPSSSPQAQQHPLNNILKSSKQRELETIEKIANSLTKGLANDVNLNNNSNLSFKSIYDNDSPKTKKQRQALKLRNAELLQSNSNGSSMSGSFNENSNHSNDNAVHHHDVPKTIENITPLTFPPPPLKSISDNALDKRLFPVQNRSISPHSNSQSSDSSSSSSSSSQSSQSSSFSSPIKLVNKPNSIPPLTSSSIPIQQEEGLNLKLPVFSKEKDLANGFVQQTAADTPKEKSGNEEHGGAVNLKNDSPKKPLLEVENKLQEMFSGLGENSAQLLPGEEGNVSRTPPPPIPSPELIKDLTLPLSASNSSTANSKPPTSPVKQSESKPSCSKNDTLNQKPSPVKHPKEKDVNKEDSDKDKDLVTKKQEEETQCNLDLTKTNQQVEKKQEETTDEKPLSLKVSEVNTRDNKAEILKLIDKPLDDVKIEKNVELSSLERKPLEIINEVEAKDQLTVQRPVATKGAKKTITDSPLMLNCLPETVKDENVAGVLQKSSTSQPSSKADLASLEKPIKEERKDADIKIAPKSSPSSIEEPSKKIHLQIDDEKPSTSKAAAAALEARTKAEKKAAAAAARKAAALANQPTTTKAKGKTNNKNKVSVSAAKKNQKNQKKKTGKAAQSNGGRGASNQKNQQMKRKQNGGGGGSSSSDEEIITTNSRDANNTSTTEKYKSPYILVKKDGSVTVVNAPTSEDINDKPIKKTASGYSHDRKKMRGLHSSTLGKKYDADTTDPSWICVFCKRGPHKLGLGDLFGPYEVSTNCNEYKLVIESPDAVDSDEEFASKRRRKDMIQKDPRCPPVVPAAYTLDKKATNTKKSLKNVYEEMHVESYCENGRLIKRQPMYLSNNINFIGMTKNSETTYEIWMHEDCAVWAPNVFLVGNRITNLQAAVWNSLLHYCNICGNNGAMICCLNRSCKAPAHISCAQSSGWCFDETQWQVFCDKHIPENLLHLNTSTNDILNNNNELNLSNNIGNDHDEHMSS